MSEVYSPSFLRRLTSQIITQAIQGSLWLMRRYDLLINKSVASINNPNYFDNPYTTYKTLRERGVLLRSAQNRGWITFSYDECKTLLSDKRVGSDIRNNTFLVNVVRHATGGLAELPLIDNPTMINIDAPDHTRLRKLAAQGFVHKFVMSLAPKIDQIIDELLNPHMGQSEIDLIEILAKPLPAIVIAEMMGVPVSERHRFEQWSEDLIGLTAIQEPAMIRTAALANGEMRRYLANLVEEKRHQGGQDLISHLLAAEQDGDKLSLEELYSTCVLMLVAGHETTTRLIGNCLFRLLQHPNQLSDVRESLSQDEKLLDAAIEESLRFDSPVQLTIRFTKEDMTFRGKSLKKHQVLMLCLGGANHDPEVNPNPDEFDIHREHIQHISFGHGIHLCLGMTLARLEAKLALKQVLARWPELKLADEHADWGTNDFFRGLNSLRLKT